MSASPRFPIILVAADLGPTTAEVLRRAHALSPARLVVCHVIPESYASDPLFPQFHAAAAVRAAELRAWATEELRRQIEDATGRLAGEYEAIIEEGRPDTVIVRLAEEQRADLVVVGHVGATGLTRLLVGSVALRVVRAAQCPVLVTRAPVAGGAVLAATDLSDPSLPAVRAAAAQSGATHARLVTLYCIDRLPAFSAPSMVGGVPYIPAELLEEGRVAAEARLTEVLEREHVDSERRVAVGIAASQIVDTAAALGADLVVIGSHGRSGLSRFLLGSTAESVVRDAPSSVLVVRLGS